MNSTEIERALRRESSTKDLFFGVFAADQLPKERSFPEDTLRTRMLQVKAENTGLPSSVRRESLSVLTHLVLKQAPTLH